MPESFKVTTRERLPGVDLIQIEDSARVWGHLNSAYSFGSMRSWRGQLEYRRRAHSLGPGQTFLFDPGELFRGAPSADELGSFRVLEVRPELFEELCRAEGVLAPVHFASIVLTAPRVLKLALDRLSRDLCADEDALTLQSRLVQLWHAAFTTVLEHHPRSRRPLPPLGPCERLRERLHGSEASSINLSAFARAENCSQFQLLRTFKRRYGSPPHAYALHVRVERGRELLRRGLSVAEAAAATNFSDQSHFTRHFRRIWGMTPGAYASACG